MHQVAARERLDGLSAVKQALGADGAVAWQHEEQEKGRGKKRGEGRKGERAQS